MEPLSVVLIAKALDGLAMRASAISQNVANANSATYRPLRVDFEARLRAAAEQGPDAVRALQHQFTQLPPIESGAEMRLDLELASASETALRYGALVEVLGRQMVLTRLSVTGGR